MAALNFPNSPTNGQTYSSGGKTWVYVSATSSWENITGIGYFGSIGYTGSAGYTGSRGFTGSVGGVGGSDTNVLFNDSGVANGSPSFVFNKTTGFIGIGASNPTTTLQIGDLGATDATNQGRIKLEDNPTGLESLGGLEFTTSAFGSGYGWKMTSIDTTGAGVHLLFGTRQSSTSWSEILRLNNTGYVGIGTLGNPTRPLDVRGNIIATNGTNSVEIGSTDGNIELVNTSGNAYIDFKSGSAEDYDCRILQSGNGLLFYTGGDGSANESMRISNTGNVAIGSISASNKLSVTGNIQVTGGIVANGSIGSAGQVLTSDGSLAYWAAGGGGGGVSTIAITTYTSGTGTFTANTSAKFFKVYCCGGGGGGGGSDSDGSSGSASGGGGGGGTAIKFYTPTEMGATASYTVGTAGSAGSSSGGNGGSGGSSTFNPIGTGATLTGSGGSGGTGTGSGYTSANGAFQGGAAGGASNGDENIEGESGTGGWSDTTISMAGAGGGSYFGGGARGPVRSTSGTSSASAGDNFGGAGSGSICTNDTGGVSGGTGSAGIIIVIEYI